MQWLQQLCRLFLNWVKWRRWNVFQSYSELPRKEQNHHHLHLFLRDYAVNFHWLRWRLLPITSMINYYLVRGILAVYMRGLLMTVPEFAIKRLKLEDLRNEVVFIGQLHHPNLISLIGYCIDEGLNILVYEFLVNGNLFSKLHDSLSWKQRLKICVGVARALHYLHTGVKQTIIHDDVKPTNILLDKNLEAKLSDFKLSKMLRPGFNHTKSH